MELSTTDGGLIGKFKDRYGNQCSIQKSNLGTEDAIWFGIDSPKLRVFETPSLGKYMLVDMPANFSVDTRMHLTKDQIKELLPILTKFAETGEL